MLCAYAPEHLLDRLYNSRYTDKMGWDVRQNIIRGASLVPFLSPYGLNDRDLIKHYRRMFG